jgi:purine nucleoside phosphorylase
MLRKMRLIAAIALSVWLSCCSQRNDYRLPVSKSISGISAGELSHDEVLETGKNAAADFARLLNAAL